MSTANQGQHVEPVRQSEPARCDLPDIVSLEIVVPRFFRVVSLG
jgi:hypothetical protein